MELVKMSSGEDMCAFGTLTNLGNYRIGCDKFAATSKTLSKHPAELTDEKVRSDLLRDSYEISVCIETGACGESVDKFKEDPRL